jgi:hypothetical protein
MSEQAPERPPGGGNMLTRKIGGVPAWGWIAVIAVGAGILLWIRSRKSSSASGSGTAQAQPVSATCYDANGNTVDCSSPQAVGSNATDYFEALYAQNEGINGQLETISPEIAETGQDVDTLQQQVANLGGPPPTGGGGPPGPVTDLTVDVIGAQLARASWRPPQFSSHAPTSTTYTVQVQPIDKAPHNVGSRTSYNIGGLKPNTHYTVVVAPAGGPSTSRAFTTPKKGAKPAGTRPMETAPNPGGPIKRAA